MLYAGGILLTMVDSRTNYSREITTYLYSTRNRSTKLSRVSHL